MKVYERNESADFTYPDEMIQILDYLNKHGKILAKPFRNIIFEEFSQ